MQNVLILKDLSKVEEDESVYEVVEDDTELLAVSKVFEELLEDVDIEMQLDTFEYRTLQMRWHMTLNQEAFKKILKEQGLKVTNQRLLVLEVLEKHRG